MDTLVDPVEALSSSRFAVAPPVAGPRPSSGSLDPDAQVQWFERVFEEEPALAADETGEPPSIDVEVLWDEENDTAPTLVLRRRVQQ